MIELRKLKASDKKKIAELLNNKKIWDNLTDKIPYPYTEEDAEAFLKFLRINKLHKAFAIEYKGDFCGIIGLIIQEDIHKHSAELGYWIGEPFWNKGIISNSIELIVKYGFSELNLQRIFASVFEYNVASMKALEKNGFLKEGILKKAVLKNNKLYDEHRFYRLKDN